MKVGRLKSTDQQGELFEIDRLLGSEGAARSWVGDFFEQLLASLTGARRIRSDGGEIFYWFWRHTFPVMTAYTIRDLRRGLAACCVSVSVLRRVDLAGVLANRPLRPINSKYNKTGKRNGYGDPDLYGRGWVFPVSAVTKAADKFTGHGTAEAYGNRCAFKLHASFPNVADMIRGGHLPPIGMQ